jgi:hypothetical protein
MEAEIVSILRLSAGRMANLLACWGRMVRLFTPEGEIEFVEAGWMLIKQGLELGALTMFLCVGRELRVRKGGSLEMVSL